MGFEAPSARRADVITAVGKTFRYADWDTSFLLSDADNTAPISVSDDQRGQLVSVFGYYDGEQSALVPYLGRQNLESRPPL